MPLYDFKCIDCDHIIEELCPSTTETLECPKCKAPMPRVWTSAPTVFEKTIPMYPGAKKIKAGYVHSHGDKNATKVQSGFGGMVNPK